MLFNCSLSATGICNLSNAPYEVQAGVVAPSYQYSKWKISNCSPGQTQAIITNLDRIGQELPSVIQAAEESTASAPFRIYFKSARELPLIREVFTNMAAGEEVQKASESHTLRSAPPEFFCAKATDFTAGYWDDCMKNEFDALTFDDEPYVLLCPRFWGDLYPTLNDTDDDKNYDNTSVVPRPTCANFGTESALPEDDDMLDSKMAIMIHELTHLYTKNQIAPEVYTMHDCADLTAAKAARNANNYALFAMSKLQLFFPANRGPSDDSMVGIIMNCIDWPVGLKRSSPIMKGTSLFRKNANRNFTSSRDHFNADPSVLLSVLDSY